MIKDLQYAIRTLLKHPGFLLIAVATLALGSGATTAMFTVVNSVLLRPLQFPEPDRIVYFQGGRQEAFGGPATLTVGSQSSAQQTGQQPQVTTLPAGVPQKIAQTPELVQIARLGRSGGVAVRGAQSMQRLTPQAQAEVRQARQTYEQMRKSSATDDIVPELYLYSVLQDHLLYDDMKQVVSEMQKRKPADPDVAVMAEYVKVKTDAK